MPYQIRKAVGAVDLSAGWNSPCWQAAAVVSINQFRVESSNHHPEVQAKVLYDADGLYVHFLVDDRYVLARQQGFNASVCRDSCVEFFFQPFGQGGYFNFEQNCGGSRLVYFISDHRRGPGGFAKFEELTENELRQFPTFHTLPEKITEEIIEPVQWRLAMQIPFRVLEKYVGPIDAAKLPGTVWRGNFYKCADDSSHRHWASWQPVPELNFHLPDSFGELVFE